MRDWINSVDIARSYVSGHTIDVLMLVIVALAMTLLLSLWSLLRRRGVRRLARTVRDVQRRLDALELAEHERTLRRIVTPDHPPA